MSPRSQANVEEFRALLDTLSLPEEAPWIFDAKSELLFFGEALATLLGLPPDVSELELSRLEDFIAAEHAEIRRDALTALLNVGQPLSLRYRIVDRFGRTKWLHERAKVQRRHDDKPEIVVGSFRDVTERTELARKLAQSEASFTDLARNVPGAIFRYVVFPDGSDSVLYMSPGCFTLWEVGAGDVLQDAGILWRMIDPEDLPAMQESVAASARNLTPWLHSWRITTPSGVRKWLRGSGQPKRLDDGAVLWNSLILDVSGEKQQEFELRTSQSEAIAASEAKSRFLASMSHELRTPLNAVIGFSEMIANATFGPVGHPKYAEYIQGVLDSGRFLLHMIDDILDVSDLEFGGRSLELSPVDIDKLVREVRGLFDASEQDRIESLLQGPTFVRGNERALKQVLINIIKNALSFARTGVQVTAMGRGQFTQIVVADDGAGMTPEDVERAFEPFFSRRRDADPFRSSKRSGLGVGLTIAKTLAEKMSGRIEIRSTVGVGTAVSVFLHSASGQDRPAAAG